MSGNRACAVGFCVSMPADGEVWCPVHRAHPLLSTTETAESWRRRVASEKRAAERYAAREAAKQQAAEKKQAAAVSR